MSWIDFFQQKKTCDIQFGRGLNATISPDEEELFNQSYEAFEKKDILNAYEYFFRSLINYTNKVANENIILDRQKDELHFVIYQGSAKINGVVTQNSLHAEVSIVKSQSASVALKRYILERNYQLTYVNYFSDGEEIKLKLYLDNITLSPQKIFYPLRELALNSDFDKEHIRGEFNDVTLEEVSHITQLPTQELQEKFKLLKIWIQELNAKVLTLPSNDNSGMQSFLYLNIFFKIDYLLLPRCKMYVKLSKKIQEYFGNENETVEAKNEELKKYLLKLQEMEFSEFSQSFYNAKYTFTAIEKSSYDEFNLFVKESLIKIRWYKNNRYGQIIPTIYRYIAFYSLYNYGMNVVLQELLHTLVVIQNTSYFSALNCATLYDEKKQSFAKREIISKLQNIASSNKGQYKSLKIDTDSLNFKSMNEFNNSYYLLLQNLNFEEV